MPVNNLLALTGRRSNSPYKIGSVAPSVLNAIMEEDSKKELLAESRSLLPDGETLSKAILDRDLFAGDQERYMGALNNLSNNFLSNYKRDPYYAFSKEARIQLQKMQDIANDPMLNAMEEAKKISDAELEKSREEGMDYNPVVEDGRALVQRGNKMTWVPLSQLEEGDSPINFNTRYSSATTVGSGGQPIKYDMSDWKTVLDRIRFSATGLGSEEFDNQLGNGLRERTKSNVEAANERLKWLNNNGFSKSDINAIQSEYIKRTGDVGPNTFVNALNWMYSLGQNYLKGSLDVSETLGVDPALSARKAAAETMALNAQTGPYERMLGQGKGDPQAFVMQQGDDPASLNIGTRIDAKYWTSGERLKDSIFNEGDLPLSVNRLFLNILENPNEPVTTPDGVEINLDGAIVDNRYDVRKVYDSKTKKWKAYVPIIYATDEMNNSAAEKSKYIGKRDPKTGTFSHGKKVGEAGDWSNDYEKRYSGVRKAIKNNNELYPTKFFGTDDIDLFDDNIYQGIIEVTLRDDLDTYARELDGNPMYSDKRIYTNLNPQAPVVTKSPWVKYEE
jgi:hypothetical protein